jgi:uracil-DNA glycosylase
MAVDREQQLRAYVDYLRDMGVHDFYRRGEPVFRAAEEVAAPVSVTVPTPVPPIASRPVAVSEVTPKNNVVKPLDGRGGFEEAYVPKPVSFNDLAPLPEVRVALADRADALRVIQEDIGDCTRCPLAYAGRRKIVFADGDPGARLMFVGEGPGADEDESGIPFVGKAGQLLNNMIVAMGLKREEVYIANIVKCRPPGNRTPEPVEANTCSQFLLRQMDVVQPEVVVALGSTAATYLLGVKQSLAGLRGRWHDCRGAKLAVTYHPAFLLRDPRMKGEAWKDLQMVMVEMGLKPPAKS